MTLSINLALLLSITLGTTTAARAAFSANPSFLPPLDTTSACPGTLYDSGGPNGNYGDNEYQVFTICPEPAAGCIILDLADYDLEPGFDFLEVYGGPDTSGALIARVTGRSSGRPYRVETGLACVTVVFRSDFVNTGAGFVLNWSCSPQACEGVSVQRPAVIPGLPFSAGGLSTCNSAATLAEAPCTNIDYLAGPDYVFRYRSPGECIGIRLSEAPPGTGVLVVYGSPLSDSSRCVANGPAAYLESVDLSEPGDYYIIVANAAGCIDFDITIEAAACPRSPALVDALCQPLNQCKAGEDNSLPTSFSLQPGFQDFDLLENINGGCWKFFGPERANFFWFSVQAAAPGELGFILQSAGQASDLDINVWGPFDRRAVCDNPAAIVGDLMRRAPLRSTFADGDGPTGLVALHPETGQPVMDAYDCGDTPGEGGDDFVSRIPVRTDEVYIVLLNDYGGEVGNGAVAVDWSPTTVGVLDPVAITTQRKGVDTLICPGGTAVLRIEPVPDSIAWLVAEGVLSCRDCPNPTAMPTVTTTYQAAVFHDCTADTVAVTVTVDNLTVTIQSDGSRYFPGQEIELQAVIGGADTSGLTYQWTGDGRLLETDGRSATFRLPTQGAAARFSLTVQSALGCSYTALLDVPLSEPDFTLPDVFSPNGDGINDRFRLFAAPAPSAIELRVYNRWGQPVFQATSNDGWDGTVNGHPAPADVYVYLIRFQLGDGRQREVKGEVTLLR